MHPLLRKIERGTKEAVKEVTHPAKEFKGTLQLGDVTLRGLNRIQAAALARQYAAQTRVAPKATPANPAGAKAPAPAVGKAPGPPPAKPAAPAKPVGTGVPIGPAKGATKEPAKPAAAKKEGQTDAS